MSQEIAKSAELSAGAVDDAPPVKTIHAAPADGNLAVPDRVIGERLGLMRPRDIRKHIRRAIQQGRLREGEHFLREAPAHEGAVGGKGGAFLLTAAGALKLTARIATPAAEKLVDEMIRSILASAGPTKTSEQTPEADGGSALHNEQPPRATTSSTEDAT